MLSIIMVDDGSILQQQIEYYRARSAEYDEWYLRKGRYDSGKTHHERWFSELDIVREASASGLMGAISWNWLKVPVSGPVGFSTIAGEISK